MNAKTLVAILCLTCSICKPLRAAETRPNIVFILADDMGYGDPHCFNAQSDDP